MARVKQGTVGEQLKAVVVGKQGSTSEHTQEVLRWLNNARVTDATADGFKVDVYLPVVRPPGSVSGGEACQKIDDAFEGATKAKVDVTLKQERMPSETQATWRNKLAFVQALD